MSVAAVRQQLQASESGAMIELGPYLSRLCETLAASMIGDRRTICLQVHVSDGTTRIGRPEGESDRTTPGLGTTIVEVAGEAA
jgi:hypothetical protein